tara:strand:+ start:3757 stop:4764 length:1008 start_codon:yes stop_codon:yes gene_type:complete
MANFTPGIHENIKFSSETAINDKGTLVLVMEAGASGLAAAVLNNEMLSSMKTGFMIFPPQLKNYKQELNTPAQILQDVLAIRDKYIQYATIVSSENEALAALGGGALFQGLGVAQDQFDAFIETMVKEDTLNRVMKNLNEKFLNFMKSKPGFTTNPFRHKFVRQSKKKHYATIPFHYQSPIVESMSIPKTESLIEWSPVEIKSGKNDGTPLAADLKSINVEKKASLFGAPTAATANVGANPLLAQQPQAVQHAQPVSQTPPPVTMVQPTQPVAQTPPPVAMGQPVLQPESFAPVEQPMAQQPTPLEFVQPEAQPIPAAPVGHGGVGTAVNLFPTN